MKMIKDTGNLTIPFMGLTIEQFNKYYLESVECILSYYPEAKDFIIIQERDEIFGAILKIQFLRNKTEQEIKREEEQEKLEYKLKLDRYNQLKYELGL